MNIMESFLIIAFIVGLQAVVYTLFLRPIILAWGATEDELKMSLPGDDLAPWISSTRAISIDAPISEVWRWVIQLGADRGGFFSYSFIEKALGYEKRDADIIPEFQDMEVGRIVPASIDESKSLIKYNFLVVAVDPGKSFVLEEWGAFVLKEIDSNQTRLIVRNHGRELPNLISKIVSFVETPLHYIMERRMLMGFKARAEAGAGVRLSSTPDNLWLSGVLLSGIGIAQMVFVGGGILGVLLSVVIGIVWLWPFLVFDPRPEYSLSLLLVICIVLVWLL